MPSGKVGFFTPQNVAISQSAQLTTAGPQSALVVQMSGTQWATARFVFAGPCTASQTFEFDYSIDGVNWIASGQGAPYVKRVDAVSANPSVVFGSTATVGGNSLSFNLSTYGASTWELPLAANVQAVRILALGSPGVGLVPTVTVTGGLPYVPNVPITATMFDVTSAADSAINSALIDLSGWRNYTLLVVTPAGGGFTLQDPDDTGTNDSNVAIAGASVSGFMTASSTFTPTGASFTLATGGSLAVPWTKRMNFINNAVVALTSRNRMTVFR